MPGADTTGLVARLKKQHATDVVYVVGHSDTLRDIIKALGGPMVTIGSTEFDNLFILVPATGAFTRVRFPGAANVGRVPSTPRTSRAFTRTSSAFRLPDLMCPKLRTSRALHSALRVLSTPDGVAFL